MLKDTPRHFKPRLEDIAFLHITSLPLCNVNGNWGLCNLERWQTNKYLPLASYYSGDLPSYLVSLK